MVVCTPRASRSYRSKEQHGEVLVIVRWDRYTGRTLKLRRTGTFAGTIVDLRSVIIVDGHQLMVRTLVLFL
jgi:hypothetical protein